MTVSSISSDENAYSPITIGSDDTVESPITISSSENDYEIIPRTPPTIFLSDDKSEHTEWRTIMNMAKTIYYDGHEHEDVTKYREEWNKRMMARKDNIDEFLRDATATWMVKDDPIPRQKLVYVTHDECTHCANDGRNKKIWLLDGSEEPPFIPKGTGAIIMVSEFQ